MRNVQRPRALRLKTFSFIITHFRIMLCTYSELCVSFRKISSFTVNWQQQQQQQQLLASFCGWTRPFRAKFCEIEAKIGRWLVTQYPTNFNVIYQLSTPTFWYERGGCQLLIVRWKMRITCCVCRGRGCFQIKCIQNSMVIFSADHCISTKGNVIICQNSTPSIQKTAENN